jgi:starch synthase
MLNTRKEDLVAIPNGVDTDSWDPAKDELIAHHFTKSDMRGKADCKRDLQRLFGLPENPLAPVLALGSRITHQKMADVALAVLPDILQRYPQVQAVVLGCGDRRYEQGFRELAGRFPERTGICIGYDERHAHALHAGADMLLHGTRFEPFGLTPLYAMRYGTIPIASRVGGIIDSIADAGLHGAVPAGACGILFDSEEPSAMTAAVERAFELHAREDEWQAMQRNAMSVDMSWHSPAKMYIDLYRSIAPAGSESLSVDCSAMEAQKAQSEIRQLENVVLVPVNEAPARVGAARPAKRKKAKGDIIKLPLKAATMLVQ